MTPSLTKRGLFKPDLDLRSVIAFLCILLILVVGAAQLFHSHNAGDEARNPGCSLCAVAHLTALTAPAPADAVAPEAIALLRSSSSAAAPPRYFALALCVRPPPVWQVHA